MSPKLLTIAELNSCDAKFMLNGCLKNWCLPNCVLNVYNGIIKKTLLASSADIFWSSKFCLEVSVLGKGQRGWNLALLKLWRSKQIELSN